MAGSDYLVSTSVYLVQSLDNGGVYVGISANPRRRWNEHKVRSKSVLTPLYASMRAHGVDRHQFSLLETYGDRKDACESEVWLIAYLRAMGARVFNLREGGDGSSIGFVHTAETRAKMSRASKGRKLSDEHRQSISRFYKDHPEVSERIATANRGRPCPRHVRARISQWVASLDPAAKAERYEAIAKQNRGRQRSDETRRRLSQALSDLTPELEQRVRELRAEGKTAQQIWVVVGRVRATVRGWLLRLQLKPHPRARHGF